MSKSTAIVSSGLASSALLPPTYTLAVVSINPLSGKSSLCKRLVDRNIDRYRLFSLKTKSTHHPQSATWFYWGSVKHRRADEKREALFHLIEHSSIAIDDNEHYDNYIKRITAVTLRAEDKSVHSSDYPQVRTFPKDKVNIDGFLCLHDLSANETDLWSSLSSSFSLQNASSNLNHHHEEWSDRQSMGISLAVRTISPSFVVERRSIPLHSADYSHLSQWTRQCSSCSRTRSLRMWWTHVDFFPETFHFGHTHLQVHSLDLWRCLSNGTVAQTCHSIGISNTVDSTCARQSRLFVDEVLRHLATSRHCPDVHRSVRQTTGRTLVRRTSGWTEESLSTETDRWTIDSRHRITPHRSQDETHQVNSRRYLLLRTWPRRSL